MTVIITTKLGEIKDIVLGNCGMFWVILSLHFFGRRGAIHRLSLGK